MRPSFLPALLLVALLLGEAMGTARADYRDEIGYSALVAELQAAGKPVPNGAGVAVTLVEANTAAAPTYAYLPDASLFHGVTITNASAAAYPATISGHANTVGERFFGDASMAAGVSQVTAFLTDHWIGSGFLNASTSAVSVSAPRVESRDVLNASWVGTAGSTANDKNVLSRLDYAIQRDDFVAVVATNNGETPANLPTGAYNVISVGLSNGGHAEGSSAINPGVKFPHLVVPEGATSFATPVVSAAAALLIETARGSATTSANGAKSETIKAVLLAGATKDEFSNWTRTDQAPLDATYGAGQLDVQNSHGILTAGEQPANGAVAATGWDFGSISLGAEAAYSFDLATEGDISIALTWNAIYGGTNFNALSLSLANLDLYLYAVGPGGALSLIQQSLSASNVEAIWATGLGAGKYRILVTYGGNAAGAPTSTDYALAWQFQDGLAAVPEPEWAAALIAGGVCLLVVVRWRRFARG